MILLVSLFFVFRGSSNREQLFAREKEQLSGDLKNLSASVKDLQQKSERLTDGIEKLEAVLNQIEPALGDSLMRIERVKNFDDTQVGSSFAAATVGGTSDEISFIRSQLRKDN